MDVKRLAASFLIAAQEHGFSAKQQDRIVLATVGIYRTAMYGFASMKTLDVWYSQLEIEATLARFGAQLKPTAFKRTKKALAKARTRDSMSAFSKLTADIDGVARIVADPPLIVPIDSLAAGAQRDQLLGWLQALLEDYRVTLPHDRRVLLEQFALSDFARKVVGVGSVGTRTWIALLSGRDGHDPLFLQTKEAETSVLEAYLPRSKFDNHGQRVVVGQHLMQAASDIFLGWLRVAGDADEPARDFYGRQLRDWKGSVEIGRMAPSGLAAYGRLCGWTLARAHARTGDRIAIAAYLGRGARFDDAMLRFSHAYADQNARDYQTLVDAVKAGKITAATGL